MGGVRNIIGRGRTVTFLQQMYSWLDFIKWCAYMFTFATISVYIWLINKPSAEWSSSSRSSDGEGSLWRCGVAGFCRWVARMCWDGQNDTSNATVGYVGEPGPQNPLLSSTTMTEPFIIDGFPPSCGWRPWGLEKAKSAIHGLEGSSR